MSDAKVATAAAVGLDVRPPSVADAQEHIVRLIASWNSRYRYVLAFRYLEKRVFVFASSWSVAPTPQQPLPSIRVSVEFRVTYPKLKHVVRAASAAVATATHAGLPEVTWRIEHEQFVHRATALPPAGQQHLPPNAVAVAGGQASNSTGAKTKATADAAAAAAQSGLQQPATVLPAGASASAASVGIDHHLARVMQFQSDFNKAHPVFLENPGFFESRQRYESVPDVGGPPLDGTTTAPPTTRAAEEKVGAANSTGFGSARSGAGNATNRSGGAAADQRPTTGGSSIGSTPRVTGPISFVLTADDGSSAAQNAAEVAAHQAHDQVLGAAQAEAEAAAADAAAEAEAAAEAAAAAAAEAAANGGSARAVAGVDVFTD